MHSNKLYLSQTALVLIFLHSTNIRLRPILSLIQSLLLVSLHRPMKTTPPLNNAMCYPSRRHYRWSTWLHPHTWKTTIIIHIVHPYLVLRPSNSAQHTPLGDLASQSPTHCMRKPPSLISCATIRLRPQRFLTKTILQWSTILSLHLIL